MAIKSIEELSYEEFMEVININLVGGFACLPAQVKAIAHAGSIVNLPSVAGHTGSPGLGPYGASKHGILGLTRTAAEEAAWNVCRNLFRQKFNPSSNQQQHCHIFNPGVLPSSSAPSTTYATT